MIVSVVCSKLICTEIRYGDTVRMSGGDIEEKTPKPWRFLIRATSATTVRNQSFGIPRITIFSISPPSPSDLTLLYENICCFYVYQDRAFHVTSAACHPSYGTWPRCDPPSPMKPEQQQNLEKTV